MISLVFELKEYILTRIWSRPDATRQLAVSDWGVRARRELGE